MRAVYATYAANVVVFLAAALGCFGSKAAPESYIGQLSCRHVRTYERTRVTNSDGVDVVTLEALVQCQNASPRIWTVRCWDDGVRTPACEVVHTTSRVIGAPRHDTGAE